ncbi:MAG: Gfo/Idh/MocA family protein [Candidatus Hodarchaeota archaeon]
MSIGQIKEKLKIGIIGCGRIANIAHLPAIAESKGLVELVAVVDSVEERAQKAHEKYASRRYYTNIAEALTDPEIEAFIICLPHYLHGESTIEALNKGKHVLVEKPLALTVEEADRMIRAAETHKLNLMVGQNRRFFKAAVEAKKRMNEIGRPLHIVNVWFHFRDAPPSDWWTSADKTGGLLIPLNGSHAIDFIIWLTGKTPVRVYAEKNRSNPKWEGVDDVTIMLGFDDGLIGTVALSFNSRCEAYERYIIGSDKTMYIKNDGTLSIDGTIIVEDNRPLESFKYQLEEFVQSIREGREPIASAKEVRKVVEVISAVTLSAKEKRLINI